MCVTFQLKRTTLTFWAQIYPKRKLGFKIQKANVGMRTSNFAQNRFWGQNFKNLSLDSESASSRYQACQFSSKMDKFDFSVPNLAKNEFLSLKLRKQMLKQKSASSIYHVCQLLDKTNKFDFFGPNLHKKEFKVGNS